LDYLTLEDGADTLSRNVGKYQATLRNIPEERGSLKSRQVRLPTQSLFIVKNTNTLCRQNAEFFLGLNAGGAYTYHSALQQGKMQRSFWI
jgi:hypothetical protein